LEKRLEQQDSAVLKSKDKKTMKKAGNAEEERGNET